MNALVLEDVHKDRGQGLRRVQALRGVSLAVACGEVVLVEGPSGAGKTTLLAVAAGLLSADRGEVILDGHPLSALGPAARRTLRARAVGFVFQRANLLPRLTARDNVLLAAATAGLAPRRATAETDLLFEALGIADVGARHPDELSGGQEHRVAIARALVHRPAVVFADEPTGHLDSVSGRAVAAALASLAIEVHAAVIVATHDPRLHDIASRRVRIEDGRLRNGEVP